MTQLSELQTLLDLVGRRLDLLDAGINTVADRLETHDVALNIAAVAAATDRTELTAAVTALTRRVVELELILEPEPPRPVLADTITIGDDLGVAETMLGWTSVHDQDHSAKTRDILKRCSAVNNHHFLGFGQNTDPQPGPGAAYDWRGLDAIYGPTGYFPNDRPTCLTLCGCPPHMRTPKPGYPPDPMGLPTGAELTSLFDYSFPHSSWFEECSDLYVEALARYRPAVANMWNEGKKTYFGTASAGSKFVQPSWGIPALTGANRWWVEGLTALSNMVYRKKQLRCPEVKLASPYYVINTYDTQNVADHADGPMPYDWHGDWGHGDRKVLRAEMYFIQYGLCDYLAIDVKTSNKGDPITADNQWNGLQKIVEFQQWLRKLAVYDPVKYAKAADYADLLWAAEWYARGRQADLSHAEEAATIANSYIEYGLKIGLRGALMWAPQGHGATDPADSNPLGLWTDAPALAETELVAVCEGLVKYFPPGTLLQDVITGDARLVGVASDTMLCLVSRSDTALAVIYGGEQLDFAPFEVRFITRAPA